MLKVSAIIFVIFFTITETYGQATTTAKPRDSPDTQLLQPICKLDDFDDKNPNPLFAEFAKYEECKFHLFMDKLQEIDCYIIHKHMEQDAEYNCVTQECLEEVFNMRGEIYAKRVDEYTCKCNNSRNATESINKYSLKSNLEYDYFISDPEAPEEPEDTKIYTLCEYIECWDNLWRKMTEFVKEKLVEVSTNIQMCTDIGQKNDARCSGITFDPTKCTLPNL